MSADRSRLLTQGAAVLLGACAFTACADPSARTDLRPAGPPDVLTVLVMNDAVDHFVETATFCKENDEKRPGLVPTNFGPLQVCVDDLSKGAGFDMPNPDDTTTFVPAIVEDALPLDWYVRIQFDELLDENVETLVEILDEDGQPSGTFEGHIMNTAPVTLTCGGIDIPYDGYYSPSGNNVTWPVGPSLVVRPLDATTVATSTSCTIQIKPEVVKDKEGVSAPTLTNVTWSIAPLEFLESSPAAIEDPTMPDEVAPEAPVSLIFNAAIDPATLAATEVVLETVTACDAVAGTARTAAITGDAEDPTVIVITDAMAAMGLAFAPLTTYRITFAAQNEVADIGAPTPGTTSIPTDNIICFTTLAVTP